MVCPVSVQIARDECISLISDVTKEMWGIRPRYNYATMTLAELVELQRETLEAYDYYVEDGDDLVCTPDPWEDAYTQEEAEWLAVCPDQWDEIYEKNGW